MARLCSSGKSIPLLGTKPLNWHSPRCFPLLSGLTPREALLLDPPSHPWPQATLPVQPGRETNSIIFSMSRDVTQQRSGRRLCIQAYSLFLRGDFCVNEPEWVLWKMEPMWSTASLPRPDLWMRPFWTTCHQLTTEAWESPAEVTQANSQSHTLNRTAVVLSY